MATKTRRAIIYARKSTEDDRNPGKSIADQIRVCEEEAANRGLVVVDIFKDSGVSASRYARKTATRKDYQKLVEFIETGECEYLIMAEQSRSSRRISELGTLMELSAEAGVIWIVGGRELDPSEPADIVLASVQAGIDASESSRLSKRAKRGAEGSARQGKPSAKNVFGYARIYASTSRALESVQIVPEEAAVIRRIVDACLAGKSLYSIAEELQRDAVAVPADWVAKRNGREPKGGRWIGTQVKRIATTPVYVGKRVHHGAVVSRGIWEPIVTEAEHQLLNQILNNPDRKKRMERPGALKHWLSGLAKCGECEGRVVHQLNRKKYSSYVCANPDCHGVGRTAVPLEAMVKDAVIGLAARPSIRSSIAKRSAVGKSDKAWLVLEDLNVRLGEVEVAIASGTMPVETGARIVRTLEAEIEQGHKKASKLNAPILPAGIELTRLSEVFDSLECGQKRMIAAAFVEVTILRAPKSPKFDPTFVRITAKGVSK